MFCQRTATTTLSVLGISVRFHSVNIQERSNQDQYSAPRVRFDVKSSIDNHLLPFVRDVAGFLLLVGRFHALADQ